MSVRAFKKSYCIRVDAYLIWSFFSVTTYQLCLPHDAHLRKPPPKSDHEKKKPTLSECLKSWLRQIAKSGGFATVDVAVEAVNLEESIDKTTSGDGQEYGEQ